MRRNERFGCDLSTRAVEFVQCRQVLTTLTSTSASFHQKSRLINFWQIPIRKLPGIFRYWSGPRGTSKPTNLSMVIIDFDEHRIEDTIEQG